MQIWADVLDANGARIGDGPVTAITGMNFTKALDGGGSFSFSALLSDERARTLLTNERGVVLYLDGTEVGRGIIRNISADVSASNYALNVSGPEYIDELKYYSVLLARSFNNQSVAEVARSLAALAGWVSVPDLALNTTLTSARFDGVTVLKALQQVAIQNGLHLRSGTDTRTVEIGAFGSSSGLTLVSPSSITQEGYADDSIAFIDRISVKSNTDDVINWLLPIGAGEGEAALTLRYSTRSGVQTATGPNGKPIYYITNADSLAQYGVIQKVGVFKDISPIGNSITAQRQAANALFDAAKAYLDRYSQRLDTYTVSARKVKRPIRPGDKIRINYTGQVVTSAGRQTFLSVNQEFWVMKVTQKIGTDGVVWDFEITSVDRYEQDAAEVVVGALEDISIRNLKPMTYPSVYQSSSTDAMSSFSNNQAEFVLQIDEAVTAVTSIKLTLRTRPLWNGAGFALNTGTTPNTLEAGFFFFESKYYPRNLQIYIKNNDYTGTFGKLITPTPLYINAPGQLSTFQSGNSQQLIDYTLDITDEILNMPSGYQQRHIIQVFAIGFNAVTDDSLFWGGTLTSGRSGYDNQGIIECTIRVLAVSQSIIVTG